MAGPIASLFVALGLDAREFTVGIDKATSSVKGFTSNTKLAMTAIGGVATLGFAALTKGALESEAAQGKFQAATGASAEEAKAFVKDMDSLAGSTGAAGKSFEEIASAGTAVAQQFGLTGKAGAALTDDFLEFAKVTGQDATGAVNDFDAALDAFGEPAERAAGLMDQLVASNQKYGTDAGPAAVDALAQMAPVLQGMNLGLDEGVGLLNLMESAGINAADGTKILKTALDKLPDGSDFNDLIAQLGAIEDPVKRAAAASEILGPALGPKLANAIKPGMTSLDEFGISADEAADASDKAADAMLTTGDKIKGFFDKLSAGLRDVSTDFGPVLTGFATIASTIVTIAPALIEALGPGIKKAGGVLGKLFGESLSDNIVVTAVGAAGTIIGNLTADLVKAVTTSWDKVAAFLTTGATGAAIARVGAISSAIYAAAAGAVEALAGALTRAWLAIPGSASVMAAARAAGNSVGLAFQVGFIVAIPAIALALLNELNKKIGVTAWWSGIFGGAPEAAEPAASAAGVEIGATVGDGIIEGLPKPGDPDFIGPIESLVQSGEQPAETGGQSVGRNFVSGFGRGIDGGLAAMPRVDFGEIRAFATALSDAYKLGTGVVSKLTQGLWDNRSTLFQTAADLKDVLKNGLTPEETVTEALGKKWIRLVRRGMESERIGAKEKAQQLAADIINTIEDASGGTPNSKSLHRIGQLWDELLESGLTEQQALQLLKGAGVDVNSAFVQGLLSPKAENKRENAGGDMADDVRSGINSRNWNGWGWNTAGAWITGFKNKFEAFSWANLINSTIGPKYSGQSPPKEGPLHYIDKWGFNVGAAWIEGFGKALGMGVGTVAGPSMSMPTAALPGLALAAAASGNPTVINIYGLFGGPSGLDDLQRALDGRNRQTVRGANRTAAR